MSDVHPEARYLVQRHMRREDAVSTYGGAPRVQSCNNQHDRQPDSGPSALGIHCAISLGQAENEKLPPVWEWPGTSERCFSSCEAPEPGGWSG